ncbi:MAG: response regulator [Candidatus Hydrogenedens sp.]|nr:response regulator [Candidatus Hydrogenedens sp.]
MLRKRQARGGIERKFVTSILWVGVIPMALALIIGYVFAREGQQIAVHQNLATAVQTTAGGIRQTLEQQLQVLEFVAHDPEVIARLMAHGDFASSRVPTVLERVSAADSGHLLSYFVLYDAQGCLLLNSPSGPPVPPGVPDWLGEVSETQFVDFLYSGETGRYYNYLVAPVRDPSDDEIIGYLGERRDVHELLRSLLQDHRNGRGNLSDPNRYELINIGADGQFVVYLDERSGAEAPPPKYYALDHELAERLGAPTAPVMDSFYESNYDTRGESIRALMAYHRLDPQRELYLLAYRDASDVFWIINLGAALTLFVTSMVIGVFLIVAYRNVNNNIIRPVSLLNEGAQIVRQGDLDLKLIIDTGDEIEELAMSFNKMATALRQNISQLEESEERYRSLFDSMRDGVFQTTADGRITLMNPAGLAILGYDAQETSADISFESLFVEEMDLARVTHELERERFIERTRVWMRRRDGRSICVELAAGRVFDEGLYVGLEGTFQDVTQNVRLEREARERSERISAINTIANVINSSLESGMVYESLVDEVRKLTDFDYAAVALRDMDRAAGDESPIKFLTRQLWPETGRNQALREDSDGSCAGWVARYESSLLINNLPESDPPFTDQFPHDIRSCLCVPLYASGRIIGTLNIASKSYHAFTQQHAGALEEMAPHVAVAIRNAQLLDNLQRALEEATRARERLHEANEELKTLDEMKTNLLSNVSHELRTPLVAVMGYTDMILNRKVGPINEVQEDYLSISLRNIEKLVSLIENLLDFSRLNRGDEDICFDTFDLADCVRTSIQVVRPLADKRTIAVGYEIIDASEAEWIKVEGDHPVLVEGDKGKMGQVFTNLLSNAVKFNQSEGRVDVTLKMTSDFVEVSVSDTGIGIPEKEQDRIFNRFYQVDSSSTRKYGGTGIGLAIVQDIVRLHGSNITVSSKEGEGTTFRFTLPLSPTQRRASSDPEQPHLPLPTETHLLVELLTQDRALSNQIRSMLVADGMDVIHAAYPAVALSLANKYSPDCIIVDTEAGPLGSVVLEEILSDPSACNLPIILLTNDDSLLEQYKDKVAARVKRGFRKSTLLGGIHYALSKGVSEAEQLGNKVLCVDDDEEIQRFITRCLINDGYDVETCNNGEEALRLLDTGEYWMVLLDIAMPGIDGWETCARIRRNPRLAGMRIHMVTAKPVEQATSKLTQAGADGFLLKPFKSEELLELFAGFQWRKHEPDSSILT